MQKLGPCINVIDLFYKLRSAYVCVDTVICTRDARVGNYFVHCGQKMPLYKRGEVVHIQWQDIAS